MRLKLFVAESLKKSKQRFEEFEFEYFGGSDVANKLYNWECRIMKKLNVSVVYKNKNSFPQGRSDNPGVQFVGNSGGAITTLATPGTKHFQ